MCWKYKNNFFYKLSLPQLLIQIDLNFLGMANEQI